jgi:hypothetical protein
MRSRLALEQSIVRGCFASFHLQQRLGKDLIELCRHSPL